MYVRMYVYMCTQISMAIPADSRCEENLWIATELNWLTVQKEGLNTPWTTTFCVAFVQSFVWKETPFRHFVLQTCQPSIYIYVYTLLCVFLTVSASFSLLLSQAISLTTPWTLQHLSLCAAVGNPSSMGACEPAPEPAVARAWTLCCLTKGIWQCFFLQI